MSVNSNKSVKSKNEKSFNDQKHNNQSYNENSFNTTINNYFNSQKYYKDQVTKYNSVDRIGIYDRVDEIITCEVIFTWQEKIISNNKKAYVVINVLEKGILIADHIHVDVSDYEKEFYLYKSRRAQITGVVYAYGKDNEKRGIKLIEAPLWLSDSLKTNQEPEYYSMYSMDKCNMKLNSYDKKN